MTDPSFQLLKFALRRHLVSALQHLLTYLNISHFIPHASESKPRRHYLDTVRQASVTAPNNISNQEFDLFF